MSSTLATTRRTVVSVRLDKWLHVARAYKTRSQATRACTLGRVRVNGAKAKAHRSVQIGDRVEVEALKDWTRILVVQELWDKPLPKAEAAKLYLDESPPRPELDPVARLMRRPAVVREAGAGRPTKRDRRKLDRLRGDS